MRHHVSPTAPPLVAGPGGGAVPVPRGANAAAASSDEVPSAVLFTDDPLPATAGREEGGWAKAAPVPPTSLLALCSLDLPAAAIMACPSVLRFTLWRTDPRLNERQQEGSRRVGGWFAYSLDSMLG